MADERSKEEIFDILCNINRQFEIIDTKWEYESRVFEAKIRTQIPRDNEDFNGLCDEWVDLFSTVTDTVWAKKISNTGPKIRFRKQYQCWTHGGKVIQKQLLFDPRKCKATLDIKVLTDNLQSRRKNRHIKLGLNVVVKLNFHHLHSVDTNQPFAFFVHNCEPQPDIPRPHIQPNERLSERVAAMVQNGPNISKKAAEKVEKCLNDARLNSDATNIIPHDGLDDFASHSHKEMVHVTDNLDMNIVQDATLHTMDPIKLEEIPLIQQCTQFVVSTPQFDMTDHFLMCQPLVFETSQLIPVNTQNITTFLHVQSGGINQSGGQFL